MICTAATRKLLHCSPRAMRLSGGAGSGGLDLPQTEVNWNVRRLQKDSAPVRSEGVVGLGGGQRGAVLLAISSLPPLAVCLRRPGPAGEYQPSQPPQTVAPVQPHQPGLCTNKASLDHGLGAGCLWTILGSCGKSFRGSPGGWHAPTLPVWADA